MAKPYKRSDSPYWWIAPVVEGVQCPQSSKTTDYADALDKLRILEGRIASGEPITPRTGKILINELLDDYVTQYKAARRITDDKNQDLKDNVLCRLAHLRPAFGKLKASQFKQSHRTDYIRLRQEADAENATINRELSLLKTAFNLGKPDKIATPPKIKLLPEDNERDEFFEPAEFRAVLSHCHPLAVSILSFAYITGWRIESIVSLEWRHVDLSSGFVRLTAQDTKNKLAVRWPLVMGLREILEERRRITDEIERRGRIVPRVFHRNGKPVKSIRTAWELARIKAKLPQRWIHDFRGTATVNLLEAGVDLIKVMGMVGFKSVQMVARYARKRGLRESSLNEAGAMLEKRLGYKVDTTKTS